MTEGQTARLLGEGTKERTFATLMTIKLGTGLKTTTAFRHALKDAGCKVSRRGDNILGKSGFVASIAKIPTEVELCVATVAELAGRRQGGMIAEILTGVTRVGGDLCPAEVGPQLRLQYRHQPFGECLFVAMEPISGSGSLFMVCVGHSGFGRKLDGSNGNFDGFLHGSLRFVFVRRLPAQVGE